MKFNSINKCLPDVGTQVLIKIKKSTGDNVRYYVCDFLETNCDEERFKFREADGYLYFYWLPEEVEGWMYANNLDLIEID